MFCFLPPGVCEATFTEEMCPVSQSINKHRLSLQNIRPWPGGQRFSLS